MTRSHLAILAEMTGQVLRGLGKGGLGRDNTTEARQLTGLSVECYTAKARAQLQPRSDRELVGLAAAIAQADPSDDVYWLAGRRAVDEELCRRRLGKLDGLR